MYQHRSSRPIDFELVQPKFIRGNPTGLPCGLFYFWLIMLPDRYIANKSLIGVGQSNAGWFELEKQANRKDI